MDELSENAEVQAVAKPGIAVKLSRAVSFVSHPWLLPAYVTAIVLFGETMMRAVPVFIRTFFLGIISIDTVFLPAATVLMLRRFGIMSPLGTETGRDRIVAIAVTGLCYVVAMLMMRNIAMAFMIYYLFSSAIAAAVLSLTISFFRRISLHMVAAGGAVAALGIITFSGVGDTMAYFLGAVLLAGLAGSARIYLGRDTLPQVAWGFVCGLVSMFVTLKFFI